MIIWKVSGELEDSNYMQYSHMHPGILFLSNKPNSPSPKRMPTCSGGDLVMETLFQTLIAPSVGSWFLLSHFRATRVTTAPPPSTTKLALLSPAHPLLPLFSWDVFLKCHHCLTVAESVLPTQISPQRSCASSHSWLILLVAEPQVSPLLRWNHPHRSFL